MSEKLEILLQQIGYSKDNYSNFDGAVLDVIKGNKEKDKYVFFVSLKTPLKIDAYQEFVTQLPLAFPTIKYVSANFTVSTFDQESVKDYYNYFMNIYIKDNPLLEMFKDNKIMVENNSLKIEVANLAEKMKFSSITAMLLEDLDKAGFKNFQIIIDINSEINNEIDEEIKQSLNVEVPEKKDDNKVKTEKPVYSRQNKKSDDPNVVMGRPIDGAITNINNIIAEVDNIIIEGHVFGVDYFESPKTNFKIITLKITD